MLLFSDAFLLQSLLLCVVDEISDLNDHLVSLQQTKERDQEMFEHQLQLLENENRETKEQLMSDNMMLGMCFSKLSSSAVLK